MKKSIFQSWEFWTFLYITVIYLDLIFNPLPISTPLIAFLGLIGLYVAKKTVIKDKLSISVFLVALGSIIFYTILSVVIAGIAFKVVPWWKVILLGITLDIIFFITGFIPVAGDIFGALIGFIACIVIVGVPLGIFMGVVAAIVAMIPFHIPMLVTISFIGIKLLLEALL